MEYLIKDIEEYLFMVLNINSQDQHIKKLPYMKIILKKQYFNYDNALLNFELNIIDDNEKMYQTIYQTFIKEKKIIQFHKSEYDCIFDVLVPVCKYDHGAYHLKVEMNVKGINVKGIRRKEAI